MSTRKQPSKIIRRLVKQVWRFFQSLTKALINWFLRTLFVLKRRTGQNQAGFVLPTIVMVMLVVILLTTSILIRSFNRPKNASNMRVDQATYAAATPALERARAKLRNLFSTEETELKGNTPDDTSIADVFEGEKYTFGDETQLKLAVDYLTIDAATGNITAQEPDGIITPTTADQPSPEQLQTAWKFPVDTDNNGLFDSFTLYGIYYRTPPSDTTAKARKRSPIEARTLPQDEGELQGCGSAGNAGGSDGWTVQSNGQLKKSFFTYVATVPITTPVTTAQNGIAPAQFEVKQGSNKGFSGLEIQQDQARIALDNNAVWYRNDLEIIDPTAFKVNGRVHTNGNLLVAGSDTDTIEFYQVSSPGSCQYKAENSKIFVGGNVIAGALDESSNRGNTLVQVDLFKPKAKPDKKEYINSSNVTTTSKPAEAASNNEAYDLRLNLLVKGAMNLHNQTTPAARKMPTKASVASMSGRFPKEEVIEAFNKKVEKCDPNCKDSRSVLENLIKRYFEARIRKVPNAEVPIADTLKATGTLTDKPRDANFVFSGGGTIAAPRDWMVLEESITKVPLNLNELEANKPTSNNNAEETLIGDRILVGNGLPYQWLKTGTGKDEKDFAKPEEPQKIPGATWNDGGERERRSRIKPVTEVDDTSRDGYWEGAAAFTGTAKEENDKNPDLLGGLRIITGAGVYVDGRKPGPDGTGKRLAEDTTPGKNDVKSFLPSPPTVEQLRNKGVKLPQGILARQLTVVWPESMPSYQWKFEDNALQRRIDSDGDKKPSAGEGMKGDLQMKATVVYHYASELNNAERAPIACISSYYNNTNDFTANPANGITNNGINYNAASLIGQRSVTPRLERQARMIFPDGRLVNERLKEALDSLKDGLSLTLSEIAALDATNCALNILDGSATPNPGSPIPDGAIKEAAFLDARQVKALHKSEKLDGAGTPTVAPETLLADITDPKKLEIAELAELPTLTAARYDLPMEQRQPLEVRVTEIDLSRATGINRAYAGGTKEYLIPNSGIIYATRDDALPDISDPKGNSSATDFKLDPTRHPNGIRLVNGQNLARVDTFRKEEKGFILASDLPVYIKGDFNLHLTPGGSGQQMEEFKTPLLPDYGNFYDRTRTDRNKNFACREKGANCEGSGDQWRAARIISDAVTIQSANFSEGLRADGDYDLNNNAGNWAVESRLKNGFWWNSFATTAPWLDPGTGRPKNSSYVMNDVTPIQRRTRFPAYLMEACLKKPVSACGPDDWYVGAWKGVNNLITAAKFKPAMNTDTTFIANNAGNTGGTTADQAKGIFEGAARRVAFQRGNNGQLLVTADGFAQPIAADGTKLSYGTFIDLAPYERDNALWFWTTISNTNASPHPVIGSPPTRRPPSYDKNTLLYYEEALETASDRQLFLPGTPEFPDPLGTDTVAQAINKLNGDTTQDASDYSVCMGSMASQVYTAVPSSGGTCPVLTAIGTARTNLINLAAKDVNGETIVAVGKTLINNQPKDINAFPATTTVTLTATAKVNVYDIPNNGKLVGTPGDLTITLDNGNQSDPIFVFRKTTGFQPLTFGQGTSSGVKLELKGVSPNNIFWVANRVTINTGPATPNTTTLAGNFLGRGNLTINGTPTLEGVRFLGFSGLAPSSTFPGTMTAMTSTDEPLLVPVLQLHSPTGTPNAAAATAFGSDLLQNTWLPPATPTNVNAVLVMGDSPSRPIPNSSVAESGGGLQNFPRFMERWTNQGNKINGSLIQFRRSSFATAPFQPIDNPATDTSLFFDGATPEYTVSAPENDYRYRGGSATRLAPFYMPPVRAWGYDVGLLSQSPDLFSKNFAAPSAGSPNEYYREVGKDDEWVKPLLCAVQKADPKDPTSAFNTPALVGYDRPKSCPPISSYN